MALLSLGFGSTYAATPSELASAWLQSQVQADGSLFNEPTSIATPLQNRAEVLQTLTPLATPPSALIGSVSADTEITTEFVARRSIALKSSGSNVAALTAALLTRQNSDGGFGGAPGYESNALDTAWALLALKSSGSAATVIGNALGYLQTLLTPEGFYSVYETADIYTTALVLQAFGAYASQYTLVTTSQAASNYLVSQQITPGNWGDSISLSAWVYLGIHDFVPLQPIADALKAVLLAAQNVNSAWENDPYVTALALRALIGTATLPANPSLAVIQGKVVDGATGAPLSGVSVTLSGAAQRTTLTLIDGVFEFRDLPPGNYTIELSFPDYSPLNVFTTANSGQTVSLGVLPLVKPQGATSGTITGVVTDAGSGLPLSGVVVSATGAVSSAVSDVAGKYQITNVTPGAVIIKASKAGYATMSGSAELAAGGLAVFSPALTASTLQVTAIQGTVTNAVNAAPIAGVKITLTGANAASTFTDALGSYRIEGLAAGLTTVTYSMSGYDTVTVPINIAPDSIVSLSPKLYAINTAPADANKSGVAGTVIDAGTGQPLPNTEVQINFSGVVTSVTTAADGRFSVNQLTGSSGTLTFLHQGYHTAQVVVALQPLTLSDLGNVRLRKEGSDQLLPDLVVRNVGHAGLSTDPQTLIVSGTTTVNIANQGDAHVLGSISLLAFHDNNRNGVYDKTLDTVLGQSVVSNGLAAAAETSVQIAIQGSLPFRDAPLHVWVDADQRVAELREDNNVARTPCNTCINFFDNFNDGVADGWTEVPNQINHSSNWSVINGEYVSNSGGGSWAGGLNWTDYTAQVRLRFPNGATNDAAILFRYQDPNNWYQFRAQNNLVRIVSRINGVVDSYVLSASIPIVTNQWYALKVVVQGNRVQAYLDDQLVFDYTGLLLDHGTVGMMDDGVLVHYDDVRVSSCIEYSEGAAPDLTASYLRVQDYAGVQPSVLTVRVGNGGEAAVSPGASVAFYSGDPKSGGALLGISKTTTSLKAGEYEDVSLSYPPSLNTISTLYIVVDDDGTGAGLIQECDEANNSVNLSTANLPGVLSLTVSAPQVSFGANTSVPITAVVTNAGSFSAAASVHFSIEVANTGMPVATLPITPPVSVGAGSYRTVLAEWNTGTILTGAYQVKAQLLDTQGRPYAEATAPFSIVSVVIETGVSATLTMNKSSFAPFETILITDRIRNTSLNNLLNDLQITSTVLTPNGSMIWTQHAALAQLLPGDFRDINYAVPLGSASAGIYQATLLVQDNSGQTLAVASTSFHVQSTSDTGFGLIGTLAATPKSVYSGATLTLNATAKNSGNASLSNLPLTLRIVDPQQNTVVQQWSNVANIAVNQTVPFDASWTVTGTPGATYVAVLGATVGSGELTLASDSFTLASLPPDSTPDAFSFTAQTDVPLNSVRTSNPVTLSGINVPVSVSVSGGTSAEYSINGGAWSNIAGTIKNGDALRVRQTSSDSYSTLGSAIVTVGDYSTNFNVTTLTVPVTVNSILNSNARILVLVSCKVDTVSSGSSVSNTVAPDDPNCVSQRVNFIDIYLTQLGIAHRVVTTTSAFTHEFRCGRYNTYWISGGGDKLTLPLAKEVREAVFRGDALILDGVHDERNGLFDEVVGIKLTGKQSQQNLNVVLNGNSLPSGTLSTQGRGLKLILQGGLQLADFGSAGGDPAIVTHSYNLGKGILFGFDWVGTLQAHSTESLYAQTLVQGLNSVLPVLPAEYVGGAYAPFSTTLKNTSAAAVTVELVVTLPAGVSYTGANLTPSSASTTEVKWTLNLAPNKTQVVDWSVRLPYSSGTYNLLAVVNRLANGTATVIDSKSYALKVAAMDTQTALLRADLQALSLSSNDAKARDKALEKITAAQGKLANGEWEEAIENYLQANDELSKIKSVDTAHYRVRVDRLLQEAEQRWCTAIHPGP